MKMSELTGILKNDYGWEIDGYLDYRGDFNVNFVSARDDEGRTSDKYLQVEGDLGDTEFKPIYFYQNGYPINKNDYLEGIDKEKYTGNGLLVPRDILNHAR